jgi:hypothetical protein
VSPRDRRIAVLFSIAGIGLCCAALIHFLLRINYNYLPWTRDSTIRDHYLAVGQSYTQGFAVGFFLCFFLAVAAISIAPHIARARQRSAAAEGIAADHHGDEIAGHARRRHAAR